jgi:hypothetical protein
MEVRRSKGWRWLDELIAPQRIPIGDSWRLERNGDDCRDR